MTRAVRPPAGATHPRRAASRVAGVLIALTVAALDAAPSSAQQQDEPPPAALTISQINRHLGPGVGHDHVLSVRGTVVNNGRTSLHDLRARAVIGDAVRSRSELADVAARPRAGGTATPTVDVVEDLAPGASATVRYDIRADQLPVVGRFSAVHPLRIELRSRGDRGRFITVGAVDTFLPWWPAPTATTRVAWVWPLMHNSPQRADALFAGDDLVDAIAEDGRLADLLAAGRAAPRLTWAVDPELLEAVERMTRRYDVIDAGGRVRRGSGSAVAASWLQSVRAALATSETLAVPYGDPDVVALVRGGLASDVTNAVAAGEALLARLGVKTASGLQWPPGGVLDARTLDVLVGSGTTSVVLSPNALPADPGINFTPTATDAVSAIGRTVAAGVADAALSELVAVGPLPGVGTTLALQRWAAETAIFTLERPSAQRDVVITPPRLWDPDPAYARGLLQLTRSVPWLAAVPVSEVTSREPETSTRASTLTYGVTATEAELPPDFVAAVSRTRTAVRHFRTVFTSPNTLVERLDAALLRAESSRWRENPGGGRALLDEVTELLGREQRKIRVFSDGVVTLTSDSGQIPITVVNDLDHEIQVSVRLRSTALVLRDDVSGQQIVVAPRSTRTLPIRGKASKAGVFEIGVRVLTPDGEELSATTLRVRSTAYGVFALAITGGAFAVLIVTAGARIVRRRRRTRAADVLAAEA